MIYIYTFLFCFTLVIFAALRLMYPFWSIQPVFHVYDFWRYFCKTPTIIRNKPMPSKYTDPVHITTRSFLDISENELSKIVDLMQCHMMGSENAVYQINLDIWQAWMKEHTDPCYVSVYQTFDFQMVPRIDSSSVEVFSVEKCPRLLGSACSRPVHLHFSYENTRTTYKAYFLDHICVSRHHTKSKNLGHYLIQNHIYTQMFQTPEIQISILKKEGDSCLGAVPLTSCTISTFCLYPVKLPSMKHGFVCKQIHSQTQNILSEFLESLSGTSGSSNKCAIYLNIGSIVHLMQKNLCFVYALQYKSKTFAMYLFKDTKIQYDEIGEGCVLECMASFTHFYSVDYWDDVFFAGFLSAIYDIQSQQKGGFAGLRIHPLGHSHKINDRWLGKYKPIFQTPCSYYLYNAFVPQMPLPAKDCFVFI